MSVKKFFIFSLNSSSLTCGFVNASSSSGNGKVPHANDPKLVGLGETSLDVKAPQLGPDKAAHVPGASNLSSEGIKLGLFLDNNVVNDETALFPTLPVGL